MKGSYHGKACRDTRHLSRFFATHGQLFLPFLDLIEQSSSMIGEVLEQVNGAFIEGLLELSAMQVAGPPHQGRGGGPIRRHGHQRGRVMLSDRQLRVRRPRLRRREGAEVSIPVYDALQDDRKFQERVEALMMRGVSTRDYATVISELAETAGVSKSNVSREFIESSARSLETLTARRWDEVDLLVIYLDGIRFGDHHVLAALGVDSEGRKHVLGLVEGASENAEATVRLLEDLVERGVDSQQKYLFVIDGSKALRSAIRRVFGSRQKVQRCRLHKIRNVRRELPDELADQVVAVMKAAFRLEPKEGKVKLEQQAKWLATEYPGAAASLREGIDELFTVNDLGLPPSLFRCLTTTNIIESPFGTLQKPMRRVTRWRDGQMVTRWAASSFLTAEKKFRRIMGYSDLWMLEVALERKEVNSEGKAA